LSLRCPEDFPLEKFSFENFKFSWFSIMARAFGKRLPWTALVPFADCLNHGNLQTKYDYDVNDNGLFRLFPSGSNSYTKGSEVFNSYGRRANDNLLLDYGFAMLDNEWDTYEVMLTLPPTTPLFDTRKEILGALGYSTSLSVNLNMKSYPLNALAFLRIVLLSEGDLEHLVKTLPAATSQHDGPETVHSVFNVSHSIR
jgi:Rubisco LSMT substrate-binding